MLQVRAGQRGPARRPALGAVRLTPVGPLLIALFLGAPAELTAQPVTDTLRSPPVLVDLNPAADTVEVLLVAAPARLPLVPGPETDVWVYNGSLPGPTLDVREGDHVIVRFRNDLPEPTTIHWHGLHLPFIADGSPFHPVEAGAEFTYAFTVPHGTAGTYLYHPHPHHRTAWQVGKGLYGAVIVRAADDPLAHVREKLIILADNRLLPDGSLDFPDAASPRGKTDRMNGREGDVVFVNGQVMPTIPIRSGTAQRWRVINASAARVYRLALPGHTLLHVGSDGGLFEAPVTIDEILLANTERAELIVHAVGSPGSDAVLQSLPYDRYMPRDRPADWDVPLDLLSLQYTHEPPRLAAAIPNRLRTVQALDEADATATRTILMSQGRLNGRLMDMNRVDITAKLDATEIWVVENLVGMDHPFHLHGFRFQLLDRDGVAEPFRSWKDTVNVPKRSSVRFIVRYTDHAGLWMFHCHILEHEDDGMMGVLQVK